MPQENIRSGEELLEQVHYNFIEPARDRLKEYTRRLIDSMKDVDEYNDMLQYVLGGNGAKVYPGDQTATIVKLLWDTLSLIIEPVTSLRWAALQPFSNMYGGPAGRSMWTPRMTAEDYMAASDSGGHHKTQPGRRKVYNQVNSKWYYTSTQKRDDDPDRPVGFYNLLMNPRFYEPFKHNSTTLWHPQPLLVTRKGDRNAEGGILPTLHLDGLLMAMGGEGRLDGLRQKLSDMVAQLDTLPDEPQWDEIPREVIDAYHGHIKEFLNETDGEKLSTAVDDLKTQLIDIYRNDGTSRPGWGSWHKLDPENHQAVDQLRDKISPKSLASTFLYWLMQDPAWCYYYYYVFGSTPNTSGPSLGIATAKPISRPSQICANWMLNALGKDLAMLETQVLATERTEARISYFTRLNTHTFTKGFTTPVYNEMLRLRGSMRNSYEEESIGRASDTLKRFEYTMQTQEYLGVGAIDLDDWQTYLVEPEKIESPLLSRMMCQLERSAKLALNWRLNDLFDDPRYAGRLDALDPAHAMESRPKVEVELQEVLDGEFCADFALLAYHLQSLIQNAAEAIDLVRAVESTQKITFKCCRETVQQAGEEVVGKREYVVFTVANTCASHAVARHLQELAKGLTTLNLALEQGKFVSKELPSGKKAGGHQGIALVLAALYCNAVRVYHGQQFNVPKAFGKLVLHPPGINGNDMTRFEIRIPIHTEGEVVWIDRRIFGLLPSSNEERKEEQPSDGDDTPPYEGGSLAAAIPATRPVRILVVDDDTADRQRFRFNIRRMPFWPSIGGSAGALDLTDELNEMTDNTVFNTTVAFAWDAKVGAVSAYNSIFEFLTRPERTGQITMFLDLAWNRREEVFFDHLRLVARADEYRATIENAQDDTKPAAFKLLHDLKKYTTANPGMIQIFVVTAYKSANLAKYFKDEYPEMGIRLFMKWSDESRLRGFIEPNF